MDNSTNIVIIVLHLSVQFFASIFQTKSAAPTSNRPWSLHSDGLLRAQPLTSHERSIRDFNGVPLPFSGLGSDLCLLICNLLFSSHKIFDVVFFRWYPLAETKVNLTLMPPTPSTSQRQRKSGTPSPQWTRGLRPFITIVPKVTLSEDCLTKEKSTSPFCLTSSGTCTRSSIASKGHHSGTGGTGSAGRPVPATPLKRRAPPPNAFRRRLRRKLFKSPCRRLK